MLQLNKNGLVPRSQLQGLYSLSVWSSCIYLLLGLGERKPLLELSLGSNISMQALYEITVWPSSFMDSMLKLDLRNIFRKE